MNVPLSKKQIEQISGKPVNVISYNKLTKIKNIDKLFNKYTDGCLIHYQTGHDNNSVMGHWCILTRDKNNINFFDPYGQYIDNQLDNIDESYNQRINQDYPILSKLLGHSPYKIHYNPFPLQSFDNGSATCGRWCAVYLKYFKDFKDIDAFGECLMGYKDIYDLDELIVKLTDKLAGYPIR